MEKLKKYLSTFSFAAWSLFVFFTSISPKDFQDRTNGWISLPFINSLPTSAIAFASNPIVIAVTFFILGMIAHHYYQEIRIPNDESYCRNLAYDMISLKNEILDYDKNADDLEFSAKLDVIRTKATKLGLNFPTIANGFEKSDSLIPYLTVIPKHLREGHIKEARKLSKLFSERPIQR